MILSEVESRIARYFFHMYLPENVLVKEGERLIPSCIRFEVQAMDYDELVRLDINIIDKLLESKRFR
ncbi:hypothetical protein [Sporosarcina beigongshangi]|uniref:hypothetical protein n=1 Tax=Sporosarcina beigongshangi TaxID=2782538 RepID=UPI00193A1606|nr:hypothetical protein [Sporosarcina beigongshangi]